MADNHKNLLALNAWAKSTEVLHIWVSFYGDYEKYPDNKNCWCIRVLTNGRGKAAPLRTCHGEDLEAVALEILPKAQASFDQSKNKIIQEAKEADKRHARQLAADFREIESMHKTAEDF